MIAFPTTISRLLLPAFIMAVVFSSCCYKKDCAEFAVSSATLEGFEADELDSIIVETFNPHTGFTERIDSITINATQYKIVGLTKATSTFIPEYRIRLTSVNKEKMYELSDITIGIGSCDVCVIWSDPQINVLASYHVNGQKINTPNRFKIIITKQ